MRADTVLRTFILSEINRIFFVLGVWHRLEVCNCLNLFLLIWRFITVTFHGCLIGSLPKSRKF